MINRIVILLSIKVYLNQLCVLNSNHFLLYKIIIREFFFFRKYKQVNLKTSDENHQ